MKNTYPIVISQGEKFLVVYVPDFEINTQGTDITDAIEMAEDAISMMGVYLQDQNKPIPKPSTFASIEKESEDDIVTLVNVDFSEYRRKIDLRTVKKNCTIPSWLNFEAEKAGINFSGVLQDALKKQLDVLDYPFETRVPH